MLKRVLNLFFYGILLASLLLFDYLLGNGFMSKIQRNFCKVYCFVKKTLRNQAKITPEAEPVDIDVSILVMEILALFFTMLLLNRYKKNSMDRLDKLASNSEDASRFTGNFNHRRISRSLNLGQSYSGDKLSLLKPVNVEVPVLHMAIIDTLGTNRSQPERGDAGDIYNVTDTAILSVSSIIDKDFRLQETIADDAIELDGGDMVQFNNNRYLWDVIEED